MSQVGIAGSTKLGMGVIAAGQVGIVGHLEIGAGARIGAQGGVMKDVESGETVSGSPSMPHTQWLKAMAALEQLPEMRKELRALKKELERLRAERKKTET
jgi:UDP-3-O-[3-hydroxymyristoyl] glucosamine N-acyltransferase